MSKRTTEAYDAALKYIHKNLIPLVGSGIIIDFEKAMRAALRNLNTTIKIYGCWFHFCQALRQKAASMKDLFELIRNNQSTKDIFRRFQCVALLPVDLIEPIFMKLSREALACSKHFGDFIDYFYVEWIKRVKPEHFSVFCWTHEQRLPLKLSMENRTKYSKLMAIFSISAKFCRKRK